MGLWDDFKDALAAPGIVDQPLHEKLKADYSAVDTLGKEYGDRAKWEYEDEFGQRPTFGGEGHPPTQVNEWHPGEDTRSVQGLKTTADIAADRLKTGDYTGGDDKGALESARSWARLADEPAARTGTALVVPQQWANNVEELRRIRAQNEQNPNGEWVESPHGIHVPDSVYKKILAGTAAGNPQGPPSPTNEYPRWMNERLQGGPTQHVPPAQEQGGHLPPRKHLTRTASNDTPNPELASVARYLLKRRK